MMAVAQRYWSKMLSWSFIGRVRQQDAPNFGMYLLLKKLQSGVIVNNIQIQN